MAVVLLSLQSQPTSDDLIHKAQLVQLGVWNLLPHQVAPEKITLNLFIGIYMVKKKPHS